MDFGDVAIAGDHQALFRLVGENVGARRIKADLGRALPGDVDDLARLDRRREMEVDAWTGGAIVFANLRDDGLLAFIDRIDAGGEPADNEKSGDERPLQTAASGRATAAT